MLEYPADMEKIYQPEKYEKDIYALWEKGGYFKPKIARSKNPFVIPMPPPNVTGELHIGHALTATLEDILIRYHRMGQEPALWIPGVDHAGIATQVVLEHELEKEGKTRFDLGREKFIKRIWEWIEKYGHVIDDQHKRLGASADWTRRGFTLSPDYQEAVKNAFQILWEKKLIYQGERIINWCPRCGTAISDLENEYEEEKGTIYYLNYGIIDVATTRPETIFADVAVAVNPRDNRYKKLIGKVATLPLTGKKLPIIQDTTIDKDFGTGALKVTPAHDELDFEIGERHKLPRPQVIDFDGKMKKGEFVPKKYWGMTAEEARLAVVRDLKKEGLIKKEQKITHARGHCQRCATLTEPLISKQWFVKMKPLAEPAIKAVKEGKVKIVPKRFEKVYFHWMENIRDWCISRQVWWGHKIPIPGETDVLDTWFSSSLWPFATLGWPKKTSDLAYFYPATVLETGYDILFFWVARMIIMGLALTGKVPFEIVYLHGLVRDKRGRKMSKTLGNVIDPLFYVEKYGADALRFSLVVGTTPGNDMRLSEEKIIGYRNFANKIWNIARFILSHAGKTEVFHSPTHEDDKWIISELQKTKEFVSESLDNFRLSPAGEEIYDFIWHKFADIYIEKTKNRRADAQPTLLFVLQESLKLLHPFMPFVTEIIWQIARKKDTGMFKEKALIIASWPKK